MTVTVIKFNCGCGFQCTKVTEAENHAEVSGHSLDILGKISKLKEEVKYGEGTEV